MDDVPFRRAFNSLSNDILQWVTSSVVCVSCTAELDRRKMKERKIKLVCKQPVAVQWHENQCKSSPLLPFLSNANLISSLQLFKIPPDLELRDSLFLKEFTIMVQDTMFLLLRKFQECRFLEVESLVLSKTCHMDLDTNPRITIS